MQNKHGAVVLPLYGPLPGGLTGRIQGLAGAGLLVVLVNNNPEPAVSEDWPRGVLIVENANSGGLAGGLNKGTSTAIAKGCQLITLLDQDSELEAKAVVAMQARVKSKNGSVLGPAIWDLYRQCWHSRHKNPRLLITSGTTFTASTWKEVGTYLEWMEIDYLDHEWCSRARQLGYQLEVFDKARLVQAFGKPHPNRLAHRLGLQLYSPYRRSVALRNLRWLIRRNYVPFDIRLKEAVKMLVKPWLWLMLEPDRRQIIRCIWVGFNAPLGQRFPSQLVERTEQ